MAKKARKPTFIQASREISAEEKAWFHNVSGAGKGQVIREFFGLNDGEVSDIEDALEAGIEKLLDEQGAT